MTAFVVLMDDDRVSMLGTIKDIGKGGIGFSYLLRTDKEKPFNDGYQTVDLFVPGRSISLSCIPCKHVYEEPDKENDISFIPNLTKRCGLKFEQLSKEQKGQINHFLENYTVASAN